jgi:hypothetical protein
MAGCSNSFSAACWPIARSTPAPLELSPVQARRVAVQSQLLAGPRFPATADGIFEVAKHIGCFQIDPISVVARTHLLVPFSRVGSYDVSEMDRLLWDEKRLFHYWAHAASLVPTEQFPIHRVLMRRYARGAGTWATRLKVWADENPRLRRHVLLQLRKRGPLRTRDFVDHSHRGYPSSGGWNEGRNVDRMLDYLWTTGVVAIVGREGGLRIWDLAERWFPDWTPREPIREREATRRSALIALRALGIATPQQVNKHFTRGRYWDLPGTIDGLVREGLVVPVVVRADGGTWPGKWFAPANIDELLVTDWEPLTTLLSPFDNLIADRDRTRRLFDFDYTIEIYVPKTKRKYGYYVMPVLHGDRLVGRLDPAFDRTDRVLRINGAWPEPGADGDETAAAAAAAVHDLATFLNASSLSVDRGIKGRWKRALAA